MKRVPKMIRGIIMSLIIAMSSLGSMLYLQLAKIVVADHPGMVFGLLAIIDLVTLVFLGICMAMGLYGKPPKNVEEDEEKVSKEQNVLSDTEAEADHGFEIGLPDIPFG